MEGRGGGGKVGVKLERKKKQVRENVEVCIQVVTTTHTATNSPHYSLAKFTVSECQLLLSNGYILGTVRVQQRFFSHFFPRSSLWLS